MGRRASGGRGASVLRVGSRGGRPESGVRRWADLAGANGSPAMVLGNCDRPGRRLMGRGDVIWIGEGCAQLGLENMGVEGVVPRWAELCSPATVWAHAWRPGAPIYRGVCLVAKVWDSWGRSNWDAAAWGMPGSGARQWPSPWRAQEQAGRVACGNGAREEWFQGNKGRRSGFGRRCDAWGGQVAAPAYGSGRRHGSGKREVEEAVSGSFVIRPKFQNQFCNFHFSPSSWSQMKKC